MRKIKAVLFDLDGTTLYTLKDLHSALNHALEKNGYAPRTLEQTRLGVGNGLRKLVKRSLPEDSAPEREQKVLSDLNGYYAVHLADETVPYEGIPELLEGLKRDGILVGTVTNKPDVHAGVLMRTCFPGIMDVCVGEREGLPRKPDPALMEAAFRELGVTAEECVYVGDSDVDVEMARNCGCRGVAVTWGYRTREDLLDAGAELLADTPAELENFLRQWMREENDQQ